MKNIGSDSQGRVHVHIRNEIHDLHQVSASTEDHKHQFYAKVRIKATFENRGSWNFSLFIKHLKMTQHIFKDGCSV